MLLSSDKRRTVSFTQDKCLCDRIPTNAISQMKQNKIYDSQIRSELLINLFDSMIWPLIGE